MVRSNGGTACSSAGTCWERWMIEGVQQVEGIVSELLTPWSVWLRTAGQKCGGYCRPAFTFA